MNSYNFYLNRGMREALLHCMDEKYSESSDEELIQIVNSALEGMPPEQIESFWNSVGGFLKKALPGAVSGVATGATVGGPWGALIGALGGGLLSGMGRGGSRPPPPRPPQRGSGSVKHSGTTSSSSSAAARLLQLIQSPQIQQAITSLMMGRAGRSTIPVGSGSGSNSQIPIGAIINLIGSLANKAGVEAAELHRDESTDYLRDDGGEFVIDPASPMERAEHVWSLLENDPIFSNPNRKSHEDYITEWFVEAGLVEL